LAWRWRIALAVRVKDQSAVVFFLIFTPEPMNGEIDAPCELL
jgi:hypothetical protein